MNYLTATLILKKIIQAFDFKIFNRAGLKAIYLQRAPSCNQRQISIINQALKVYL